MSISLQSNEIEDITINFIFLDTTLHENISERHILLIFLTNTIKKQKNGTLCTIVSYCNYCKWSKFHTSLQYSLLFQLQLFKSLLFYFLQITKYFF